MKKFTGFTLIELIVTLSVATILVTLALPNFRDAMLNNRLITTTNEFIAAANLARSEAIKRGRPAEICVSSNSMEAAPSCTGGTDWSEGWLVWVDADGSGTLTDDSERLRVGDALTTTSLTGDVSLFTFDSRGAVANTGSVDVCDDRSGVTGRTITVTTTGRIELNRDLVCP